MRRSPHPGSDLFGRMLVWAGLAAVLGGMWEIGQSPFYFFGYRPDFVRIVATLLHSVLIDAAIAVAGYLVVRIVLRDSAWPRHQARQGTLLLIAASLVLAVVVEWVRVYRLEERAYAEIMPTLFGIGVIPLAQWIVLAPLIVLAMRELD